jgi:hypothetical protein
MTAILLGAALFLILMSVGLGLLMGRLLARERIPLLPDDWEEIFSPARYKAMERLLEETDYQYVALKSGNNKKLERQLRSQRVQVFQAYVGCLSHDFTRICGAIKKLMVESEVDRPDLAGLLMKQHFIFTLTVLSIEFRLALYGFGLGTPDGRDLVKALEAMCGHLGTLSLVADAS